MYVLCVMDIFGDNEIDVIDQITYERLIVEKINLKPLVKLNVWLRKVEKKNIYNKEVCIIFLSESSNHNLC